MEQVDELEAVEAVDVEDVVDELEVAERLENVCSLCPVTDAARANLPEPPELDGAPMSELRCGHQVHTHCLINELYIHRRRASCLDCHIRMMRDEDIQFYNHPEENDERRNMTILWAENEEFRNDVNEYKKLCGRMTSTQRDYTKELSVIKGRFKQNILTSVAVIHDQKRQASADLNRLQSRKIYKKAASANQRKINSMRRKWNISSWDLHKLNDIDGAPKFHRRVGYSRRWNDSPKYIFRVRI